MSLEYFWYLAISQREDLCCQCTIVNTQQRKQLSDAPDVNRAFQGPLQCSAAARSLQGLPRGSSSQML